MTPPADAIAIAEARIAEEAERRSGALNLSDLGLKRLPESLFALRHLRRLDLGTSELWRGAVKRNQIYAQRDRLGALTGLETLSVAGSDLWSLDFLAGLPGLKQLDCLFTKVSDLKPLAGLAGLQTLQCSRTQVSDLTPLAGLAGLQTLDCGNTRVSDLRPLASLTALQALECRSTQVSDLTPLSGLAGLRALDCSYTQVSDLTPLAGLAGLQTLGCSQTPVSDLTPLTGLIALQTLRCWNTKVSDLTPLAGLATLQTLTCSHTRVSDLTPLAGLAVLQTLDCSGCQLQALPAEIRDKGSLQELVLWKSQIPGVPGKVLSQSIGDNCLASVRAHFAGLAAEAAEAIDEEKADPPTDPPQLPSQGVGPHFEINAAGVIDFAPPGALDREGNNVGRLRKLHPTLCNLAGDLVTELGRGNVAHHFLCKRTDAYRQVIIQELETIDFEILYLEGVQLANAAQADAMDSDLPPLSASARGAIGSLLQLHGTFMMATTAGIDAIAAEERFQRRPAEETRYRAALLAFADSLKNRPDIITPAAAATAHGAAEQMGQGPNPERSGAVATGTVGNVAITLITGATVAACPVIGSALAGAAGGIAGGLLGGLLANESLKKSNAIGAVTKPVSALIDRSGHALDQVFHRQLRRFLGFVLTNEDKIRGLAVQRPEFLWIGESLDWIKGRADRQISGPQQEAQPGNRPDKPKGPE